MLLLYQTSVLFFPARTNSRQRVLSAGGNRCHHMVFSLGTHRRFLTVVAKAAPAGDVDTFTKYSGYLFENGVLSEAEFLTEYDLRSIAAIYRRKPFLVLRRFVQIGTKFGRWFAVRYIDRLLERSDEMFKIRASELRMILLELGPAFVKIAQAVSSRPDVIPPAYLNELSLLQDQIAPFSTELAFNIMEKELGLPIDGLFSEISPEPVAAASLGQVYQARLCTSGKIIAIKVQRPGVQAAISLDIYILRYLAGLIKKAAKLNTDLQAVLDEWASSLFREMDYREEAKNGLKFRKLYGRLQDVFVPEMYANQSSRRVLLMEWVEGKKLADVKDLYLVEVGVYCSLSQLLEYGFYHADPHPGNLLRTSDGKLAYLDFGMMGEFRQELRDGFIQACLHLVNRDFDSLAKDFVTLGLLPPTAQKDEVTKALTDVFEDAVNKGVRNISFEDLSANLGLTMYKFKFRIPSYFFLVIRSLAVLEGIAIGFDPNYKVLSSSYPWIARKVLTDSSPQLRSTLQTLLYKEGVFRIDRLESLLIESLRAKNEQSFARSQLESTDSSAAMKQAVSFTLSAKGAFVREILLQEFAKGLDALSLATMNYVSSSTSIIPFSSVPMADEDRNNLRTLSRLILLLYRLQKQDYTSAESRVANDGNEIKVGMEEVSMVLYQMTSVQDILPIFSIIPELPVESQQELVRLPADLAARLVSRMVARTIRRFFT
ncbi:uncharacterized aarF domain-containing protein kinase At1g71810, chloroplastic [Dendrobium catenatum]|uniref:uncharacterized aarF domain-containing protein kinase At1g71810, chloroplastic n=1 Tax=Dendrobium catenatum TaxID=906689 RepID=UPI0009F71E23|nr:uncharacterized aarF domain-containing protein kinase At1g71810, chloroplastic [Dendrobium catenatum]